MTNPTVTFERAESVDSPTREAILALESESFSNPWSHESFATMLASPASRLYLARDATNGVIGFCACWLFVDELHINTLAITTMMRRQGIASALLRYVLADTGASRATLEVRRSNVAARRLYEGLGFKVSAVRERYYEKPSEDGLILWLNP